MAMTRAQLNRSLRQEALREQLAEQCRLQHVLDNIRKIEELTLKMDDVVDGDISSQFELNKLKVANEQRLKLINKYLPDLKSSEHTGEGGGPVWLNATELSDDQLANIATGSSTGTAET